MGGCPTSRSIRFSPVLDPPVPIDASWEPLTPATLVTFSHSIRPDSLDTGNWFVRFANQSYPVTGAIVIAGKVQLTFAAPIIDLGPNVVSYSPPPFDVISNTAKPVPAGAFTDYPLV